MTFKYGIRSINDIVGGELTVSHLPDIATEHRSFFQGASAAMADAARDRRQEVTYQFGPTITEPGIAERWQGYESTYRSRKRINDFWVATIHDAIVEPQMLSVLSNGFFVKDNIRPSSDLPKVLPDNNEQDIRRVIASNEERLSSSVGFTPTLDVDEAFLLGSGVYKNYYNWTLRYASRLPIFNSFPKDMKLLTPSLKGSTPYVRGTMALHNVKRRDIVPVNEPVLVRTLHICAPSCIGRHELSPQLVLGLGNPPLADGDDTTNAKRIFIPRVNVKSRRVVNEANVIDTLSKLGFANFDCAQHPVAKQAQAFHAAEMIVGTHGAGFANIVYSRPGTTVVEIIPEGYDQGVTSYRSLADHFGLKYIPLFAKEVVPNPKGNRCNSDVLIDVEELVQTVRGLAEGSSASIAKGTLEVG